MKVSKKQLGLVAAGKRAPQDGPVEAFVPVKTTGQTSAHRGHWSTAARKVKREREATAWALLRHAPVRLPVVVTFTRCSSGELDDDNVRTAMKGIRDEVTAWLGLANDRDPRARWEYAQHTNDRGKKARTECGKLATDGSPTTCIRVEGHKGKCDPWAIGARCALGRPPEPIGVRIDVVMA